VIRKIVQGSGSQMPLRIQHRRVLTPAAAADVDYALSFDNVPGGTAYPDAAWPGRQVIGKTGTTETAQDAWFIGAIPQYSLGVTLFTDQQNSVKVGPGAQTLDVLPTLPGNSDGGFGGAWPAKIWNDFMQEQFTSLAPAALPAPDYNGFSKWNLVGKMPTKKKKKGVHTNPSPPPSPSPGPTCHGNFKKCGTSPSPPVPPTSPPPTSPSPSTSPTCAPLGPCSNSPSPPVAGNVNAMAMYTAAKPAQGPSGPSLLQAFGWFLSGLF
jgi:membrane peptidoglycan carboxypeptidase